ncbi:hypothetical protein BN1723_002582, partial [Verticillium longisporum]
MKTLALVAALLPGLRLGLAAPLDTRSDDMAPAVKPATTYAECQRKTCHPLDGCPPNTILVSQKSKRAHFSSIQAAINSLPITAWKGTNTTFPNKYGVYVADDSRVLAANASIAPALAGRCPLGRPWNAQHRSVFSDTYLDPSVLPAGYIRWGATDPRVSDLTFMAVHEDRGPGWNATALAANGSVTRVLDDAAFAPYRRPVDVFLTEHGVPGNIAWIDQSVLA